MFITNEVFVDSSILIEAIKGTKTASLKRLVEESKEVCVINATVISEFLFYYLAVNSTVAPLTLKMQKRIPTVLQESKGFELLRSFKFLEGDSQLFVLVPEFMAKYNLLPNDAIILATRKVHQVKNLASYDSELRVPCDAEEINLIME